MNIWGPLFHNTRVFFMLYFNCDVWTCEFPAVHQEKHYESNGGYDLSLSVLGRGSAHWRQNMFQGSMLNEKYYN